MRFYHLLSLLIAALLLTLPLALSPQKAISLEDQKLYNQFLEKAQEEKVYHKYLQHSIDFALRYQEIKEWQIAIDTIQSAIKAVEPYIDVSSDSLVALAYHKIGVSYYYLEPSDYEKAIQNYKTALEIRNKSLAPNLLDIIKSNRNIGVAYRELNQYEQSKKYLQTALDLHLKSSIVDSVLLASTYMDWGDVLSLQRDFNPAKRYLLTALDIQKKIYPDALWEWSIIYERLFDLSKNQQDTAAMFEYSITLIDLLESLEEKYLDDYELLANAYHNLALTYEITDTLDLAMFFYQKSLFINQNKLENRKADISKNLSNLSLIYQKQKKYSKALSLVNQAIGIANEVDDPLLIAASLNNKAFILAEQQNLKKALDIQQQAIQYILPNFQSNDPYKNPSTSSIAIGGKTRFIKYLSDKATIFKQLAEEEHKLKNLVAFSTIYDSIALLSEQIRIQYESDEAKQFLSAELKPLYEQVLQVNYELYQSTQQEQYLHKSFQLVEQSKSVTLLDALQENQARLSAGIPQELIDREQKLKRSLALMELEIEKEGVITDQTSWITKGRALEQLIDTFKNNYPRYYDLKYSSNVVNVQDLQAQKESSFIEYFVGEQHIHAFVTTRQKVYWLLIEKDFPLRAKIRNLKQLLYLSPNLTTDNYSQQTEALVEILYYLYQKLFAPIEQTFSLEQNICIIPDGVLGYLPFELFIKQKASASSYFKQHHYLIKDYQISYAYSANLLEKMKMLQTKKGNKKLLAIAPSFHNTLTQSSSVTRMSLAPLKHNRPEARVIHQSVGGDTLIGQMATKANFLKAASDYQILHFATHAKANDKVGDFSYLAFTTSDDQDTLSSFLYNRELYQLQLHADMVVLSACETGVGELKEGEGIISMARGFSYAGAKSIVTSLWEVNDVATKDLMIIFYQYLQQGKSKDEALRLAKLDHIQAKDHVGAHPFYWASFIAIGDMGSLESNHSFSWYWLLLLFLPVALFFTFIEKR